MKGEAARTARAKPASDLEHLIMRRVGQAIGDWALIEPGDRILVAVSGGKDSFALLSILELHRRRCSFGFELVPVFLDSAWDAQAAALVRRRFADFGHTVEVVYRDIKGTVAEHLRPGSNPCGLCARLRRGVLYDLAPERGCNKIALGHQLDDLVETLLLNEFFAGQIKSMAVRLVADDGRNIVIRPLAYVEASLVAAYAQHKHFEPVKLACPYHDQHADPRRERIRRLIEDVAAFNPRVRRSLLASLQHVCPTHLMDPALWPQSSAAAGPPAKKKRPRRS